MKNPFPGKVTARRYGDDWYRLWCSECRPGTLSMSLNQEQATYAADAINGREDLEAERDSLKERNAKLVAMLRTIEEAARKSDECPLCGYLTYRAPGEYHAKDCELAALIAEEKD